MKIFVDSANLVEIEEALKRGFPSGITTNPSILSKEEKCDFRELIQRIISLLQKYGYEIPLSVEVFTANPKEMVRQAEEFVKHFGDYPGLTIKESHSRISARSEEHTSELQSRPHLVCR